MIDAHKVFTKDLELLYEKAARPSEHRLATSVLSVHLGLDAERENRKRDGCSEISGVEEDKLGCL